MNRILVILTIAACFFAVGVVFAGQTLAEDGPSLYMPVRSYNFKPVLEGTEVAHTFVVRNQGNQPLRIEKVSPG